MTKTAHTPRKRISDDFDLLCDEHPVDDVKVMCVFGAMKRGLSKADALAKYNMSEEYYDANIERVLNLNH